MGWDKVFDLPAVEFLFYIKFWNYREKKKERQMEEFRRKTNG